ncbi:MAG: BT_3928 family protein [Rikenellaceae bacterium]
MNKPNRYSPTLKYLTHIFCIIIGLTFIVSGFTKTIDPWGTAVKFEEYFTAYGFDSMLPLSQILAVWLCGAELMMGCMILCRVRLRLISIFALISMIIFTIVTILSVTIFPVDDCGCFGETFYLTPWQTLAKNLILLPMIFTVWWRYRPDKIFVFKLREVIVGAIFFVVTMSFSAYNYLHLPMIDFLPFKVGVNLLEAVEATTSDMEYSVILVYRNITTGKLHEFTIEDTEWQDADIWEWVETRTNTADRSYTGSVSDFSILSSSGGDVTKDLLSSGGELNIITVTKFNKIRNKCEKRLEKFVSKAEVDGDHTIIITPQKLISPYYNIGGHEIECFNIDATTLKSIIRASSGIVELSDGVITSKRSCIDL